MRKTARCGAAFLRGDAGLGHHQWAYDKRLTYGRAAELGIDFPAGFHPHSAEAIERLDCRFPVILKPAFRKSMDAFTQAKAWRADDRAQLLALYRRAAALVGNDAVIVRNGSPAAVKRNIPTPACGSAASRSFPWLRGAGGNIRHFGRSSTYVETIEQSEVEELAGRFLKSINYNGVVEVKSARQRDGDFELPDVNGRFWSWKGSVRWRAPIFPVLPGGRRSAKPCRLGVDARAWRGCRAPAM